MTETQVHTLPKGWIAAPLSEVTGTISLTERKIKQSEYKEKGTIPVIDQGQDFINGYTDRADLKVSVKTPVIIFGDHTKAMKYITFDFVAGADGVKVINPSKIFSPKLLKLLHARFEIARKRVCKALSIS